MCSQALQTMPKGGTISTISTEGTFACHATDSRTQKHGMQSEVDGRRHDVWQSQAHDVVDLK